jgi:hypothetical protein
MGWLFILTCLAILVITSTSVSSSNDDCFACHATENRVINQTLYNSNPHSILECIDCHVNSTAPPSTDPGHGQFIRQMNGTNITGNLSTQYYSDNFSLCYACHSESKLVGVTLPDYYNSTSMFLHVQPPISVLSIETNFINDLSIGHTFNPEHYPANIHWDHLDAFGSTNNGLLGKFSINPSQLPPVKNRGHVP